MTEQLAMDFVSAPALRQAGRRQYVLRRLAENATQFRYVTAEWLQKNWVVWDHFEREADARAREGHRGWGARTIGEHIRRETRIRERDAQFKVNDHIWPDCARLWLILNPEREGFFETRGRAA